MILRHCRRNASAVIQSRQGARRVDSTGTPLHAAVRHRWPVEIVKLLLAAGADPNAKNHNDATPISIATELNQSEILTVLRRQQ